MNINIQKNTLIVGVIALIIGLGIGICIASGHHGFRGEKKHMIFDGKMMDGKMTKGDMSMSVMMKSMNRELKGKTGDEFDKAFLSEMIVHHEGAVEMAKLALTNANHQEIKNLANLIIIAQNKEIAEMKAWNSSWYGNEVNSSTNSGAMEGSMSH